MHVQLVLLDHAQLMLRLNSLVGLAVDGHVLARIRAAHVAEGIPVRVLRIEGQVHAAGQIRGIGNARSRAIQHAGNTHIRHDGHRYAVALFHLAGQQHRDLLIVHADADLARTAGVAARHRHVRDLSLQ